MVRQTLNLSKGMNRVITVDARAPVPLGWGKLYAHPEPDRRSPDGGNMYVHKGESVYIKAEEPTLIVVVRGIARVNKSDTRVELGPCTMLYVPAGAYLEIQAPWGDVLLYKMKSYDLGPEPRILYNGYGVKSPEGEAALCIRVEGDGTRLLLPARVYSINTQLVIRDEAGNLKRIEDGEVVRPPAKLLPENGKRGFALLILNGH